MNQIPIITINAQQQKTLLQSTPSKKYRVIILLLLDCGLRVSELIQLQCQHILFAQNKIIIESPNKSREIPLTQRLLKSLADYWQTLSESNPDSYLFPAGKNSKSPHIGRKQIWKKINQLSKGTANPTILRNTFAKRIIQENDLSVAKELLGNISICTTERHLHISEIEKETAIQSIEQSNFITILFRKFFPIQTLHIIPTEIGITNFHIGRKEELQKLHDCAHKKINLLILGEQGIGKTHLLDNFNQNNLIRIGDLSTTKKMVAGLLLHLFETDKESIANLPLFENGFWTQYNRYFGTPKHLASEFHKSPDALNVKYTIKRGTEILKGDGICIAASEAGIVLLENDKFHFLNKEKYTILEVIPEHIGKQLLFKNFHFLQISTDSLNTLIKKHPIQFIEIHSNQNFNVFQNLTTEQTNHFSTSTNHLKLDYPNFLFFQEEIRESLSSSPTLFFSNPKIITIQLQINILKQKKQLLLANYRKNLSQLDSLKNLFHNSSNLLQKEAIYQKIKLLNKVKPPLFDNLKIQELEAKLLEVKRADRNKLAEEKSNIAISPLSTPILPTTFTGTITFIILNNTGLQL